MNIVFTFRPPRKLQEQLRERFPEEEFLYYKSIDEADKLHTAEVIVTFGGDLTAEHISACKELKWIMAASAGIENMPVEAIAERNILLTNARGIHKIPMAEFTMGYMLNHVKRFPELQELQSESVWNKRLPLEELAGKQLLVIGTGAIGSEIARLALAFRMDTIGVNRSGSPNEQFDEVYTVDQLLDVLPLADFVVAVLPSTEETKFLLEKEHFQAMKKTAAFINIGRGDLVEESVLIEALDNEEIARAYLDVFIDEPLPADHPFWSQERLTVTPHISSITSKYVPRAMDIFSFNLDVYKRGEEGYKNKVDIDRGY